MKTLVAKWNNMSLVLRIVIGLVIGAILGLICPQADGIGILGTLFVGALRGVAPVLVFVLVMSALANASVGIGGRFGTVIMLYMVSTLLAAVVAVIGSFLFPVTINLNVASDVAQTAPQGIGEVLTNLLGNLVANPIGAIADGNYLGVLFWAVVFGLALKKLASPQTKKVITDLSDMICEAVRWIIQFAPFGIMGLVFSSVAESGLGIFTQYGLLLLLLVGCMLTVALGTDPLVAWFAMHRNPYPLVLRCLRESGLTAFFTRSSAANIPINMDLCRNLGLDPDFYSVSIPLGATINMNGAAITITVMTLAVANTLGIQVDVWSALVLSLLATIAACGASGVAGGSLLLIPMACSLFGIGNDIAMQAVAVGFIVGVVQDSLETAINSSGDVVFAAVAEYREKLKNGEPLPEYKKWTT